MGAAEVLWRRQWHHTPVLLPGKSHGWRSLVGCSPWGCEESDTTERLQFHFSLSCIGEGKGNPLQCSCLENPRDGGAWWAAIYGVAQSRTRLTRLGCSSSSWSPCSASLKVRSFSLLINKVISQRTPDSLVSPHDWVPVRYKTLARSSKFCYMEHRTVHITGKRKGKTLICLQFNLTGRKWMFFLMVIFSPKDGMWGRIRTSALEMPWNFSQFFPYLPISYSSHSHRKVCTSFSEDSRSICWGLKWVSTERRLLKCFP